MAIARIIKKLQKVPPTKVQPEKQEDDDMEELDELTTGGGGGNCIKKMMEAQQSIRMHHWLTSSHAEHKALGKAYGGLDDLIDTFVETFIGAKGKGVLSGISELSLHTEGDCMKVFDMLEEVLRNDIPKDVGDKETALLNIRDEILGLVQQTKYLLNQD